MFVIMVSDGMINGRIGELKFPKPAGVRRSKKLAEQKLLSLGFSRFSSYWARGEAGYDRQYAVIEPVNEKLLG